jgi:DivIVA domain-containing protein
MPWPSPSKHPARSDDVRGRQFSNHRPGYDPEQVDAFLDKAEPRLAAMRATDKGGDMIDDAPSRLARFHAVGP